jgi:SAM-dependent methyltransferase
MSTVEHHYTHGSLTRAITDGVATLGKTPQSITVDDLSAVDEFHIGGRQATHELMKQLNLSKAFHVLDVGSGLGGAARFVADRYGCRVTGIDMTTEYVETARTLSEWTGLDQRLSFRHGNALDMPFGDASFDAAYMLHVGMNVPDKQGLFTEVARVLKPRATFGIYDVMQTGAAKLSFPVPWAETPEISVIGTPEAYKTALRASGFEIVAERNRRDFAIEFFKALRARMTQAGGPPPLGFHIIMGPETATKIRNMTENIAAGSIAPVEIVARRAA